MLSKEDAKELTDARKNAYIKEQALKLIPICFKSIRESIKKMTYETSVHIEGVQFIPEIIYELEKIFRELDYNTSSIGGRGNSRFIHIYWRDFTDQEKVGHP